MDLYFLGAARHFQETITNTHLQPQSIIIKNAAVTINHVYRIQKYQEIK